MKDATPPQNLKIRAFDPMRKGDEDEVIALWDCSDIGRPWLDLRAEIHEKLTRDPELFLVAMAPSDCGQTERVVGCVMGAYDGRRGWIYHLAVLPEFRGQGLGQTLLGAVEERMLDLGVSKVNLQIREENVGVVRFYEKAGYGDDHVRGMGKWLKPKPKTHTGVKVERAE